MATFVHISIVTLLFLPSQMSVDLESIKKQVNDSCKMYLNELGSVKAIVRGHTVETPSGKESRIRFEMRRSGRSSSLFTEKSDGQHEVAELRCVNERYSFVLSRQQDAEWVLTELYPTTKNEAVDVFELGAGDDTIPKLMSPYWVSHDLWVPTLLNRGKSAIKAINEIGANVQIDFEYPDDTNGRKVHSGSFTLDSRRKWAVVQSEYKVTINGRGKNTTRANDVFVDAPHRLRSTTYTNSPIPFDSSAASSRTVNRFDFEIDRCSPSDFELSAFGIKEPVQVSRTAHAHWYLWLSLMIVGSLIVLFVTRRRRAVGKAR